MKSALAQVSCCVTLTLGILLGIEDRAHAASIVQVVNYQFQEHDTTYSYYEQFNPSLGTLLNVIVECQGMLTVTDAYAFSNLTTVDQTFTGSVSFRENSDGGTAGGSNTFTLTLAPRQSVNEGVSGAYDLSTTYGNNPFWVGTGLLGPHEYAVKFGPIYSVSAQSDNPNIFIDPVYSNDPYVFASDRGTETITYLYQPAGSVVPEPPAYMMLGTACLLLLAVRYSLRGFARPYTAPG